MKKLTSVVSLISLIAAVAAFAGCSSAKKAEPVAQAQIAAPQSPVNLGAASSGRAR